MSNLFANMIQNNSANPQMMAMQMLDSMYRSGKINQNQYNSLMEQRNNPQGMINVMLQSNMVSNEQYANARNNVNSFFGIK